MRNWWMYFEEWCKTKTWLCSDLRLMVMRALRSSIYLHTCCTCYTYTCLQPWVNLNMHVSELWRKTTAPIEILCRHRENIQTPNRSLILNLTGILTGDFLALTAKTTRSTVLITEPLLPYAESLCHISLLKKANNKHYFNQAKNKHCDLLVFTPTNTFIRISDF